jgi:hypothetical protein
LKSIGINNYIYINNLTLKEMKKMMTGGVKNPNASVMVQKVAKGRTGGGNAKASVQTKAGGRTGGTNAKAVVSPKRK